MCVNCEESEYVKGPLDYSEPINNMDKITHRSSKTTEPANNIENIILYEWCLSMFKDKVNNRECLS